MQKKQEAIFLSDIVTANGRSIESNCITDWYNSHEADLGRHRLKYTYSKEFPTKENWTEWKNSLSRLTMPNSTLFQPLGR